MSKNEYKRCPRCGSKTALASKTCAVCNLKFDRIENLSNKEAKKAIKNKEKEKVLYITQCPKDVNKKKFYLLYFLLGWFGIYNLYIGKFKKGYYSLITLSSFIIAFIIEEIIYYNGINTDMLNYILVAPLSTFAVFGILIWFLDLISMISKTFKFPAALSNEDYMKILLKSKKINDNLKFTAVENNKQSNNNAKNKNKNKSNNKSNNKVANKNHTNSKATDNNTTNSNQNTTANNNIENNNTNINNTENPNTNTDNT